MSARNLRFLGSLLWVMITLVACRTPYGVPVASVPSSPGAQPLASFNAAQSDWEDLIKAHYNRSFIAQDVNQDGFLSPAEIAHVTPATFAAQDRDADGRLSRAETFPSPDVQQQSMHYLNQELETMSEGISHPEAELESLPNPQELEQFTHELEQAEHSYKQLDRPPVLLVPGYAEPSWYFMYGLYRHLKKSGWQVEGINLFPNFATAEEQAQKIQARVEDMKARYGVSQVELVVHSFGGIISRYYIQQLGGTADVRNLVTIATPHHGTYVAYFGPGKSADQLKYNSPFIQALNARGYAYPPVKYTSIWSNVDEIVIPQRSAVMPDSTVHQVPWTGHLSILFSKRTYAHVLAALSP